MNTFTAASERLAMGPRFDRWLLDRVRRIRGPADLPFVLEYRHIYVMPTKFGAWFGVLLGLMAVAGLNFNNNMTLLLVFLLGSIAMLTTLLAYRNLVGIEISGIVAGPVFAGERAEFRVFLRNPEDRWRFAIEATSPAARDSVDIQPQNTRHLSIEQDAPKRGWLGMDPFRVETRFPLGLFRAWTVVIPTARCLVYPQPVPNPPPLPMSGRGDQGAVNKGEGEHFHGLREYRPGDPLRRIAWRSSARHQKLYSREMEAPRDETCELNWYLMGSGDPEQKLSILAAWVLRAERRQLPYGLELPGAALPASLGERHRNSCLEILALYRG
ncbi:MAG: DUF58 domain-containing protein [Xanthomonadales bacterium]|jgi:uncharacterized protein (DUF58 family)|nr:DUF58 domain-containing protein [Xanthomonadales bacterium]